MADPNDIGVIVGDEPPDDDFRISVVLADSAHGAVTLILSGELDIATSPILAMHLDQVPTAAGRIVVDMGAVTFMDSSGLGTLIRAAKRVPVEIRNASDSLRRVFAIAGVEGIDGVLRVGGSG